MKVTAQKVIELAKSQIGVKEPTWENSRERVVIH